MSSRSLSALQTRRVVVNHLDANQVQMLQLSYLLNVGMKTFVFASITSGEARPIIGHAMQIFLRFLTAKIINL